MSWRKMICFVISFQFAYDELVGIVLAAIHDVGTLFGECLLYESRRDRCILPRESLGNEFREGPRELAR